VITLSAEAKIRPTIIIATNLKDLFSNPIGHSKRSLQIEFIISDIIGVDNDDLIRIFASGVLNF